MDKILLALQITVIGMGIVFAAIIALWALMTVLMIVTVDREEKKPSAKDDLELKQRAAAIAVSVALAQQEPMPKIFPTPPLAFVSAWQAVKRSGQMRRTLRMK